MSGAGAGDATFTSRARLLGREELWRLEPPWRGRKLEIVALAFVVLAASGSWVLWEHAPCCLPYLLFLLLLLSLPMVAACGWFAIHSLLAPPGRAGRVLLDASGLRFVSRSDAAGSLHIAFADVERVQRAGRALHFVLRNGHTHHLLCPRLQVEDVFDRLCELLAAGGHGCEPAELPDARTRR